MLIFFTRENRESHAHRDNARACDVRHQEITVCESGSIAHLIKISNSRK